MWTQRYPLWSSAVLSMFSPQFGLSSLTQCLDVQIPLAVLWSTCKRSVNFFGCNLIYIQVYKGEMNARSLTSPSHNGVVNQEPQSNTHRRSVRWTKVWVRWDASREAGKWHIDMLFNTHCQIKVYLGKHTSVPSSVRTVFLSGFISWTLDFTHFTPDGITLAVERPDEATVFAPAPTRVHIGW